MTITISFIVLVLVWALGLFAGGALVRLHDFADNHPWLYLAVAGVVALLATLKVLHIL